MKTYCHLSDPGLVVNYNSDLSGSVTITCPGTRQTIEVPGIALRDFIAEYVRAERIAALESASVEEVLGLDS